MLIESFFVGFEEHVCLLPLGILRPDDEAAKMREYLRLKRAAIVNLSRTSQDKANLTPTELAHCSFFELLNRMSRDSNELDLSVLDAFETKEPAHWNAFTDYLQSLSTLPLVVLDLRGLSSFFGQLAWYICVVLPSGNLGLCQFERRDLTDSESDQD